MANNRKITRGRKRSLELLKGRKQVVMSEPQWIRKPYVTKSGQTKNRLVWNPNAKPIKVIYHSN